MGRQNGYRGIITDLSYDRYIEKSILKEIKSLPYYFGRGLDIKIDRTIRMMSAIDRTREHQDKRAWNKIKLKGFMEE